MYYLQIIVGAIKGIEIVLLTYDRYELPGPESVPIRRHYLSCDAGEESEGDRNGNELKKNEKRFAELIARR